jgi:squalene-associated FAD-dependent desaturase
MGCCTNLLDFCRRTGLDDAFVAHRKLHFFGPDGRQCDFRATPWLPAPLHLLPGLMRLTYLSRSERWGIVRALGRLVRKSEQKHEETIGQWLQRQGQTPCAIGQFWSTVVASALSETVDRASLSAARKVFLDGFLASRHAYELLLPRLPLGELWDNRVGCWLHEHGVAVHRGARVARIEGDTQQATGLLLADGTRRPFDFVVLAVPWQHAGALCRTTLQVVPDAGPVGNRPYEEEQVGDLPHADLPVAPITAVHLWFDRPIVRLPHAAIVGRTSQWLFNHGQQGVFAGRPGHYYQVVISASHALLGRSREAVLAEVRGDLESIWPDARDAELLHWRAITHRAAVFSVRPDIERLRPPQQTAIPNLFLAGDWTATGWPATMEGAVRSGYLAAEAIARSAGRNDRILVPDLPRAWLTRLLFGA